VLHTLISNLNVPMCCIYLLPSLIYLLHEASPSLEANRFSASQEIPRISWNPNLVTALTSARHLSLSWVSSIQSMPQHPTSWKSILTLSSNLSLGLPSGLFPSGFPTETLYTRLLYIQYYVFILYNVFTRNFVKSSYKDHSYPMAVADHYVSAHFVNCCKIYFLSP
jgi:hypothetical protein